MQKEGWDLGGVFLRECRFIALIKNKYKNTLCLKKIKDIEFQ